MWDVTVDRVDHVGRLKIFPQDTMHTLGNCDSDAMRFPVPSWLRCRFRGQKQKPVMMHVVMCHIEERAAQLSLTLPCLALSCVIIFTQRNYFHVGKA